MPSTTEKQRRFFALALSVKRGETPREQVSKEVLKVVDDMSTKELKKYASTQETKDIEKKALAAFGVEIISEDKTTRIWKNILKEVRRKSMEG